MFTIWGCQATLLPTACNAVIFLKIGAFGACLTLGRHAGACLAQAAKNGSDRQEVASSIYFAAGPSHMDMYDLEARGAVEFRGESSRNPRPTCPGVEILRHMPLQAKMWDKLAVIRLHRVGGRALRLAW